MNFVPVFSVLRHRFRNSTPGLFGRCAGGTAAATGSRCATGKLLSNAGEISANFCRSNVCCFSLLLWDRSRAQARSTQELGFPSCRKFWRRSDLIVVVSLRGRNTWCTLKMLLGYFTVPCPCGEGAVDADIKVPAVLTSAVLSTFSALNPAEMNVISAVNRLLAFAATQASQLS